MSGLLGTETATDLGRPLFLPGVQAVRAGPRRLVLALLVLALLRLGRGGGGVEQHQRPRVEHDQAVVLFGPAVGKPRPQSLQPDGSGDSVETVGSPLQRLFNGRDCALLARTCFGPHRCGAYLRTQPAWLTLNRTQPRNFGTNIQNMFLRQDHVKCWDVAAFVGLSSYQVRNLLKAPICFIRTSTSIPSEMLT